MTVEHARRVAVLAGAGLVAFLAAFLGTGRAARAEQVLSHMEACIHKSWGYLIFSEQHLGTTNTCPGAVSIWFLARDGRLVHRDIEPGEIFDTGFTADEVGGAGWVAATCAHGYRPRPAVTKKNWDVILNSEYKCVKD